MNIQGFKPWGGIVNTKIQQISLQVIASPKAAAIGWFVGLILRSVPRNDRSVIPFVFVCQNHDSMLKFLKKNPEILF